MFRCKVGGRLAFVYEVVRRHRRPTPPGRVEAGRGPGLERRGVEENRIRDRGIMSPERRERRRNSGEFRGRARSSPATLLVLTVSAVLVATAAASVLLDGGFSDATPHGRLLGVLRDVARAQEAYRVETGRYAERAESLAVEVPADVRVVILDGDSAGWEALAVSPSVGLSCAQSGSWGPSGAKRSPPECYVDPR
jgi:hypothetical protein